MRASGEQYGIGARAEKDGIDRRYRIREQAQPPDIVNGPKGEERMVEIHGSRLETIETPMPPEIMSEKDCCRLFVRRERMVCIEAGCVQL